MTADRPPCRADRDRKGNRSFRVSLGRVILLVMSMAAAGCLPLGDPRGHPVGVGLSEDGRLQYFALLCPGDEVLSVQVQDYETGEVLWAASEPDEKIRKGGRITVGESGDFRRTDTPLKSPLPDVLGVELETADRLAGARVDRREVPEEIAGTDTVLNEELKKEPESRFRERVARDRC